MRMCIQNTCYVTGIEHQRNDQMMDEQQIMRGAGGKHDVGNKTENIEQELEWRKLQIVQCHKSWHCSMCSECACASCMIVTHKSWHCTIHLACMLELAAA